MRCAVSLSEPASPVRPVSATGRLMLLKSPTAARDDERIEKPCLDSPWKPRCDRGPRPVRDGPREAPYGTATCASLWVAGEASERASGVLQGSCRSC